MSQNVVRRGRRRLRRIRGDDGWSYTSLGCSVELKSAGVQQPSSLQCGRFMELATQRPAHAVAARGRKHGSGYALVVSPPILLAPFAATVTITVDGVAVVSAA